VPLKNVFSYPTLGALAASVTGTAPAVSSEEAVVVRPAGEARPLFLVYEAGGTVQYAQVLTPHVDPRIPVYALPSGPPASLRTIEGMAARLVRMIREVQPSGPYRIAGWSFGGLLAYEIASQLIGQDQGVEFLGMFDTYYEPGVRIDLDRLDDKAILLEELLANPRVPHRAALEELAAASGAMDFDELIARCGELGILPERMAAAFRAGAGRTGVNNIRAQHGYYAQPIPVPVHFFAALEGSRGVPVLPATVSVVETPVPGTHLSMMQPPHVEVLGAALSRRLEEAAAARKAVPQAEDSLHVALQRGDARQAPLFCVPGAGASVYSLSELASSVDPRWPVYGLQPRGLDGEMVPHSLVQTAAASHLRTLQQFYPAGPLHLLGHSFGGWVVLEMARLLHEAGRPVLSLTIVDSQVPHEDPTRIVEHDSREAFLSMVEVFEETLERSLDISAEQAESLDEAGRLGLLHERLVRFGVLPRQSRPDVMRGPLHVYSTCLRTTYTPEASYDGPARLVLVADPRLGEAENMQHFLRTIEGWKRWVPRLASSIAPGNHMTVLKKPHVNSIVSLLAADRSRADERPGD
jgi:thioesterase domain-containing protein